MGMFLWKLQKPTEQSFKSGMKIFMAPGINQLHSVIGRFYSCNYFGTVELAHEETYTKKLNFIVSSNCCLYKKLCSHNFE